MDLHNLSAFSQLLNLYVFYWEACSWDPKQQLYYKSPQQDCVMSKLHFDLKYRFNLKTLGFHLQDSLNPDLLCNYRSSQCRNPIQ